METKHTQQLTTYLNIHLHNYSYVFIKKYTFFFYLKIALIVFTFEEPLNSLLKCVLLFLLDVCHVHTKV